MHGIRHHSHRAPASFSNFLRVPLRWRVMIVLADPTNFPPMNTVPPAPPVGTLVSSEPTPSPSLSNPHRARRLQGLRLAHRIVSWLRGTCSMSSYWRSPQPSVMPTLLLCPFDQLVDRPTKEVSEISNNTEDYLKLRRCS